MKETDSLNHLAGENSVYLKHHAKQPVNWYPWGDAAFEKAKQEKKPVFLSIGYSACHWCHAMSKESFENSQIAAFMNEHFINIKVDKEERPDLDKVYQTAHYFLTRQDGGWPLSLFLSPNDRIPFFSGTYFPPFPQLDMPGFKDTLKSLAEVYKEHQQEIEQQNRALYDFLNNPNQMSSETVFNADPLHNALKSLKEKFDPINGGFGRAPKFYHVPLLEFLFYSTSPITAYTLQKMAEGGVYDQLAGSFFRYSVDAKWEIPHFEKMLYDNAQLLELYALAARENDDFFFGKIGKQTAEWVLFRMQSEAGGFYSSWDADSEDKEGEYYLWTPNAAQKILTHEEFQVISIIYGLNRPANFANLWHLYMAESIEAAAKKLNLALTTANSLFSSAKKKMLAYRHMRTLPTQDKKILTAWNALTIKALANAGQAFEEAKYLDAARKGLQFIYDELWQEGYLYACYEEGKAHTLGFLNDYIYLLDAILTLLKISWDENLIEFAMELVDHVVNHFLDKKNGGFFFTADYHEKLLFRPKTLMDEDLPSANGVAAQVFLTFSILFDDKTYLGIVENIFRTAWSMLVRFPAEHGTLLIALRNYLLEKNAAPPL